MDQEQIDSRRQYVEQVRQSFGGKNDTAAREGYRKYDNQENQTEEKASGGFFKLRLIFSVVFFLVFVFLWKTDWSYQEINAKTIQQKIESSIRLPDSFPKLSDVFSIFRKS